jgi:uncharacterized protein YacL
MDKKIKTENEKEEVKASVDDSRKIMPGFSPSLIRAISDEVSKTLIVRLPQALKRSQKKKTLHKKNKKIEGAIFLDTSAIIDNRILEVISLGLLNGVIVLPQSILLELKHLADSQDTVKRERGRNGLVALEKLKKSKRIKIRTLSEEEEKQYQHTEVDERLIKIAKAFKGKLITCDYNLEKKASIENITVVNVNALANSLKVAAVPGEALHVKISHQGKEATQGVGYLDDGTMIVVEEGSNIVGRAIDVVVSRVIQTATGRILFAKKI